MFITAYIKHKAKRPDKRLVFYGLQNKTSNRGNEVNLCNMRIIISFKTLYSIFLSSTPKHSKRPYFRIFYLGGCLLKRLAFKYVNIIVEYVFLLKYSSEYYYGVSLHIINLYQLCLARLLNSFTVKKM